MTADKTLAHELCEQINVWDMFGVIDDEDDLVTNVILPAFQKRIIALAEGHEASARRWSIDANADGEPDNAADRAYNTGRQHSDEQTALRLRAFAYELTAEAKA